MTERINKIIAHLGVTQVCFAEQIGVGAASITHITKGRNNPSLDIVTRILKAFPQISSDWLLFGTGEMFKSKETAPSTVAPPEQVVIKEIVKPVDHITIFYTDGTYCNFYSK